MKLDESYDIPFLELEQNIADSYREGLNELRDSEDYVKNLRTVRNLFNHLRESHPCRDKGVEWASEIITAYRNLSRISGEISLEEPYSEIFSRFKDLLDDYDEELVRGTEIKPLQLERALKELANIKSILRGCDIDDPESLQKRLESLGELEEKIEEYEQKIRKLENL